MGVFRDAMSDVLERVDQKLLGQLVAAVSVDVEALRRRLRESGRPFCDPEAPRPNLREVDLTAQHVVRQSRVRLGLFGGMASLAGALSVPPEVAATGVAALRLAQRLAVVYGFDPDTDRGEMAVFRALAAGFEVELPERGTVGMRLSDVPRLARQRMRRPDLQSAGGALTSAVVRRSATMIGRRVTRFVPVVFSAFSAVAARDRMDAIGHRMMEVLRQLAEAPELDPDDIEDAVELAE